jgi:hypothetical protein
MMLSSLLRGAALPALLAIGAQAQQPTTSSSVNIPTPSPTVSCDAESEAALGCLRRNNLNAEACLGCLASYFDRVVTNETAAHCSVLVPIVCGRIDTCSAPCFAASSSSSNNSTNGGGGGLGNSPNGTFECGCGACSDAFRLQLACELGDAGPASEEGCVLRCDSGNTTGGSSNGEGSGSSGGEAARSAAAAIVGIVARLILGLLLVSGYEF